MMIGKHAVNLLAAAAASLLVVAYHHFRRRRRSHGQRIDRFMHTDSDNDGAGCCADRLTSSCIEFFLEAGILHRGNGGLYAMPVMDAVHIVSAIVISASSTSMRLSRLFSRRSSGTAAARIFSFLITCA